MENSNQTPSYKLHRKDGPSTSKMAAESINPSHLESLVLDVIETFGSDGCISDDVIAAFERDNSRHRHNSITARYKALKDKGLVIVDDSVRKGERGRYQMIMYHHAYYQ